MFTQVGHVAIRVTDVERALDFYCRGLGLREAFRMRRPDGGLGLIYLQVAPQQFVELFPNGRERPELPAGVAGYVHMCLLVDDLQATVDQLQQRQIQIVSGPKQGGDGNWQAWVIDPDGNRIELMQIAPDSLQARASGQWSVVGGQ